MLEVIVSISVAVLGFAGTAIGSYTANRKNTALITYRLQQLEDKVDRHNNFAGRMPVVEEQIKVINHRISDLEEKEK